MEVRFVNGFQPVASDLFRLIRYGSRNGVLSNLIVTGLSAN